MRIGKIEGRREIERGKRGEKMGRRIVKGIMIMMVMMVVMVMGM